VAVLEEDILRLDISVDEPVTVGVVERVRDFAGDPHRLVDRELMFARHPRAQRLPIDIRHHVEQQPVRLPRVVQREDVRVREVHRDLDLAAEPLRPNHGREIGVEHLQRDISAVFEVSREEDGRHPTATELALDRIHITESDLKPGDEIGHPGGEVAHRRARTNDVQPAPAGFGGLYYTGFICGSPDGRVASSEFLL
jgi:hypothetical protein